MSFREIQKYRACSCSPVCEVEQRELPSGELVTEMVDSSEANMPDPKLFDLKNQLEAGIQQEEVNSKVMQSGTVSAEGIVRKYTKKSSTPTEVKNEGE